MVERGTWWRLFGTMLGMVLMIGAPFLPRPGADAVMLVALLIWVALLTDFAARLTRR